MRKATSDKHPGEEYGSIAVTITGQQELESGTTAGQGEGNSGQRHTAEVPESVGMGYRLAGKAGGELAQYKIGDKSNYNQCQYAIEQVIVAEKYHIANSTDRAETTALRQESDGESNYQGYGYRSIHGSGSCFRGENRPARVAGSIPAKLWFDQ